MKISKERNSIYTKAKVVLPKEKYAHIPCSGRASVFTSCKAGITVEASMAVPLFFFAVVCLLYLMEMMSVQAAVRSGLQYAGKRVSAEAYPAAVVSASEIEGGVVNAIGGDRLDRSIVKGGSSGIDCSASSVSVFTGIGELSAKYQIRIPVPVFRIGVIPCEETLRIKTWTGYERAGFGTEDDTIVYVTETGVVYHRDYHCTHLELSIHRVTSGEVGGLRNSSGGKYHACERCGGGSGGSVYITDTGDRYHSSLSCSGLKRTVYAVPISEAAGKRPCSKCGRQGSGK